MVEFMRSRAMMMMISLLVVCNYGFEMQALLEKIRSFFQKFLTFLNMVNDEALVTRVHSAKMCIDVFL
jgi:hypothetical protein